MERTPKRRRRTAYRSYFRSGLHATQLPALPDASTPVGQVIAERRAALVADLGGDPSTAQSALVELALRTWCLVDAADAFLLSLPSIVDRRHRKVWQIVLDRQRLAAALEATLCRLGLERRAKQVDLAAQLAALHRAGSPQPSEDRPEHQAAATAGTDAPQGRSAATGGDEPDPTPR